MDITSSNMNSFSSLFHLNPESTTFDADSITNIEKKLVKSFPMIDLVLLQHLKKFFSTFPATFYQVKKISKGKVNLQKILKLTTHPLEVNCLRRTDMLRLIFEAAALLLLQNMPEFKPLMWTSVDTFKTAYSKYPEFQNLSSKELLLLLEFRNLVAAANIVIHPKLEYYVDLAVRFLCIFTFPPFNSFKICYFFMLCFFRSVV